MSYAGNITLADNIDVYFTTVNTSGAPTTLSGTPVVSAYEDNSTTQITAGVTLAVDFDTVTGLNHVRVAATGANGFEAGKNYTLVITTGTVGGTSVVGYVVGSFSIQHRYPTIDDIWDETMTPHVTADSAAVHLKDTLADTANMQPKFGVITDLGGGATLSANLADIAGATFSTATDSLEAIRNQGDSAWVTATSVGLTAAGVDAIWDETLTAHVTADSAAVHLKDTLADTANMQPKFGTITDLGGGATLSANLADIAGATFSTATDSLEALRNRGDSAWVTATSVGLTAAGVDAIWDETLTAHVTADSAAVYVKDVPTLDEIWDEAMTPHVTADSAAVHLKDTLSDTANMQPKLGTVVNLGGGATFANNLSDMAGATFSTTTDTLEDIRDQVDLVKTKTDSLTFTVANQVDANMLAISGDTAAANNLEESATGLITGSFTGTPTTTSLVDTVGLAAYTANDTFNGRVIVILTGSAAGEATDITDYDGTTKTLTVTALATAPSATDTYVIV